MQEGTSAVIELKEEDPQYAGILLRYFYAHDYQIDNNGKPSLAAHARVYAIADRYGVVEGSCQRKIRNGHHRNQIYRH